MEQSRKDASYMKKKLLTCLAMLVCILSLTACGKEMTQNSFITKDKAKEAAEGLCEDLGAMQQEAAARGETMSAYAEEYAEYTRGPEFSQTLQMFGLTVEDVQADIDIHVAGVKGMGDIAEEFGSFVSVLNDQTEVTITEDKAEVSVKLQGDKVYKGNKQRTATVDVVMTAEGYESITVSVNYDMSELMTKAALNTVLGMGTVFAVLILIFALISCFKFIPPLQAKCEKISAKIKGKFRKLFKKSRKESEQEENRNIPEPVIAVPQTATVEETDDAELIAVIAAAVAAYEGTAPADGYVVRSIIRR